MEEYDKEIENWITNNNINTDNKKNTNNSSILIDNTKEDYDKEDISALFTLVDKKNIKYKTIDNLKIIKMKIIKKNIF